MKPETPPHRFAVAYLEIDKITVSKLTHSVTLHT